MKLSSLFSKAKGSILLLLGVASLAVSLDASAIPVFARQTGFKCVACHVGGEYPQLTSLGRYFKLTGYTQGDAKDFWNLTTNIDRSPFAVWLQAARQWTTNNSTDINAGGTGSRFDAQTLSLFAGGKITDNIGLFTQWTAGKDTVNNTNSGATWGVSIDNTELRYADHFITGSHDVVVGAYANNRITMSDVWNTQENWTSDWIGYFNGTGSNWPSSIAPTTFLQSGSTSQNLVGLGTYVFLDKTWYAELALYKGTSHGPLSFLTEGDGVGSPLLEASPYIRLAYNKEWGPHSFELGAHGLVARAHNGDVNADPSSGSAISSWAGSINTYRDVGFDAQYQYVLDPHYFAAHFRFTHESSSIASDQVGSAATNYTNNLNETAADLTYIYQAKYGAMLFYRGASGSSDQNLFNNALSGGTLNSVNGNLDWQSWTPSIFWAPWQNVRVGYMYTFYTKLAGAGSNNGNITGVNSGSTFGPHDFNTSMLYTSIIY